MAQFKGFWRKENPPDRWVLYNETNRNNVADLREKPFTDGWIGRADFDSVVCMRWSSILIEHESLEDLKRAAERICNVKVPDGEKK